MRDLVLHLDELGYPTSPEQLFGREGPFVLEIGFGNGGFLEELARLHPDWNLLGVEKAAASVSKGYSRLHAAGISHAHLMLGQAAFCVRDIIPPRSLHRVYVNFPDPWPRTGHHARRLLQAPFFGLLSTRLQHGGQLQLTTDHQEYFQFSVDQGKRTGLYSIEVGHPPAEMLGTKYARRWQSMQKPIYHAIFEKIDEYPESIPSQTQVVTMHHAKLEGSLDEISSFSKEVFPTKGGKVVLLNAYRSMDDRALVFLVLVDANDLKQEVIIEARPSRTGVFVGLMRFGSPVITHAVRDSVRAVSTWLEKRGLSRVQEAC